MRWKLWLPSSALILGGIPAFLRLLDYIDRGKMLIEIVQGIPLVGGWLAHPFTGPILIGAGFSGLAYLNRPQAPDSFKGLYNATGKQIRPADQHLAMKSGRRRRRVRAHLRCWRVALRVAGRD